MIKDGKHLGKTRDELKQLNVEFNERATHCLAELFLAARKKNELQFALSLNPEFRGPATSGWSSAEECHCAVTDYMGFLESAPNSSLKIRVALALYCHLAEASGFYEIPKNMLRVAGGDLNMLWPFINLVKDHQLSGEKIAPNANKIMQDLVGHSEALGMQNLAVVFSGLFDGEIRNAYAHADYVVWEDGIRLPKRNGGWKRIIPFDEFSFYLTRALQYFGTLRHLHRESLKSYCPPRCVIGALANGLVQEWTISFDPEQGTFRIANH